jgi:hypothetical protein
MSDSPVTLPPLSVNKRTLAQLRDPSANQQARAKENDTVLVCPKSTKYPECDPSSYSGCACGC